MKLPQHWWLWGIDIQLDTYIDNGAAGLVQGRRRAEVEAGDGIILCSAKPCWVDAGPDAPEAYDNLDYFERKIIEPAGAKLRVALTGDLHYYARYECDGRTTRGSRRSSPAAEGPTWRRPTTSDRRSSLPPSDSPQYNEDRVRTYRLAATPATTAAALPARRRSPSASAGRRHPGLPQRTGFSRVPRRRRLRPVGLRPCSGRATGRGAGSTWPGRLVVPWGPPLVLVVAGLVLLGLHPRAPAEQEVAGARPGPRAPGRARRGDRHPAWAVERAWAGGRRRAPPSGTASASRSSVGLVGALLGPLVLALYLLVADHVERQHQRAVRRPAHRGLEVLPAPAHRRPTATSPSTRSPSTASPGGGTPSRRPTTRRRPWLVPDQPIATQLIEPPIVVTRGGAREHRDRACDHRRGAGHRPARADGRLNVHHVDRATSGQHADPGTGAARRTAPACGPTSSGRPASRPSSTPCSTTGYDVWLENWRASIDLAPCEWTLDQAAVLRPPCRRAGRARRRPAPTRCRPSCTARARPAS